MMFEKNTIKPNPAGAAAVEDSMKATHSSTEAKNSSAVEKATESLRAENKDLVDTLKRIQAEFENFQKRSAKEREQSVQYGKSMAFKEVLEFLDSFDAALAHVNDEHRKGLENLRAQLLKILERNGIQLLVTVGKRFNPELQECLMQGNDPMQAEDMVLEEFQKGYMFNGLILRTAKVKVNAHASAESEMSANNPLENQKNNQNQNQPTNSASQDATKKTGGNQHE